MMVEITYDGGLNDIAERIESGMSEIINAGAMAVLESAVSLCPVDTGTLRASLNVTTDKNSAVISADAEYSAYVEFGTYKMAPQPYLVPSLLSNNSAIISAITDAVCNM